MYSDFTVTFLPLRNALCEGGGGRGTGATGAGVVVEGIYEDIKMCIGLPAQSGAYTHYTSSLAALPPSVENLRSGSRREGRGRCIGGQGVWESFLV